MKNKGTYLSVDLDFWNHVFDNKNRENAEKHLARFLKKLTETTKNIRIVDSHEELLKHVNLTHKKFGCNKLINVDYHSDIFDRFNPADEGHREFFNCGTWANYVDFRENGEFLWILPYPFSDAEGKGFCHGGERNSINPFSNPSVAGWNKINHKTSINPENIIDWSNIVGIGVAYSYYWLTRQYKKDITFTAESILEYKPRINYKAKL